MAMNAILHRQAKDQSGHAPKPQLLMPCYMQYQQSRNNFKKVVYTVLA